MRSWFSFCYFFSIGLKNLVCFGCCCVGCTWQRLKGLDYRKEPVTFRKNLHPWNWIWYHIIWLGNLWEIFQIKFSSNCFWNNPLWWAIMEAWLIHRLQDVKNSFSSQHLYFSISIKFTYKCWKKTIILQQLAKELQYDFFWVNIAQLSLALN